jgi:type VI secretion system lysozyme-like protein
VESRNQRDVVTRQPHPVRGRRVLLFDRLDAENELLADEPYRVEEWAAIRSSVAREIQNLLNTRLAPGRWEAISEPQTVIDYGIPDFSSLGASNPADRGMLAEVIKRKLAAFEPRLSQVRLEFRPHPTDQTSMVGAIEANLTIESLSQPVSFPLEISTHGEVTVL